MSEATPPIFAAPFVKDETLAVAAVPAADAPEAPA